ncbi:hypothetical protein KCM76_23120 [Zooshikella marina]|uniref:hypothetical protein n=1 Tax=Zooshikella ganghwensis TaxID=202772 RepID=UPI001BB05565|nr:hypothetical protein [Zooshikella ganghwensis]MBU2708905.1 hypothetical protein [Zooshikella ganghwensis]
MRLKMLLAIWLAGFLVMTVSAKKLPDIAPGEWYAIPHSQLVNLPKKPKVAGSWTGFSAITGAWSGGAFDTQQQQLIIWGGGHRDYSGNELYGFSLHSLSWKRLSNAARNVDEKGKLSVTGYYPDGSPRARHTYNTLQYLAEQNLFCAFGAAAMFPLSQHMLPNTDCYDLTDNRWLRLPPVMVGGYGISSTSAYDPKSGYIYSLGSGGGSALVSYKPLARKWLSVTGELPGWISYDYTAVISSKPHWYVLVGNKETRFIDLQNPDKGLQVLKTKGDTEIEQFANVGLSVHQPTGLLVAWHNGAEVYTLNLETKIWKKHSAKGYGQEKAVPKALQNGTFGRFRYSEQYDIFILVNSVNKPVFLYRLAE